MNLSKSGGAMAPPAPLLSTALIWGIGQLEFDSSHLWTQCKYDVVSQSMADGDPFATTMLNLELWRKHNKRIRNSRKKLFCAFLKGAIIIIMHRQRFCLVHFKEA